MNIMPISPVKDKTVCKLKSLLVTCKQIVYLTWQEV